MASNIHNFFTVAVFILATSTALPVSFNDEILSVKHEKWMVEHKRYYETEEERAKRFEIFKANVQHIESFNAQGSHSYKLAVNKFADLTAEEFLATYGGRLKPSIQTSSTDQSSFKYADVNLQRVPQSLDWRSRKAVTPVQNQGFCGCCWAFSAVAAIEGIASIRSGQLTPLSEQQILDCNYAHEDCRGGTMVNAYEFVKRNGGLSSDRDYPYMAIQRGCTNNSPSSLAAKIRGTGYVPQNNEAALLKAVANQPVSVAIDPTLLRFYRSGVIRGPCGTNVTHAVTAVGYGVENGVKYWLFKNSWGPYWGDGGYVKLERDVGVKEGMCGIAMYASFPIA